MKTRELVPFVVLASSVTQVGCGDLDKIDEIEGEAWSLNEPEYRPTLDEMCHEIESLTNEYKIRTFLTTPLISKEDMRFDDTDTVKVSVGDEILIELRICQSHGTNAGWVWNFPEGLECTAWPEFDSSSAKCTTLFPGSYQISRTLFGTAYTDFGDEFTVTVTSNVINVEVE